MTILPVSPNAEAAPDVGRLRSLSEIVPAWDCTVIHSAWDKVRLGLEKERKRLAGHRFITVITRRNDHYDGIHRQIYLGLAFNDADSAQRHVAEELKKCATLHVPATRKKTGSKWRQLDESSLPWPDPYDPWPDSSLLPAHGPVLQAKWDDGSVYNSETFRGAAFEVSPDDPLPDTLLAAFNNFWFYFDQLIDSPSFHPGWPGASASTG